MTSVNYTGRKVDLLIFQNTQPTGEQLVALGFGSDGGLVTTGIQKLAQSFLSLFLTDRGSIAGRPRDGTAFLQAMQTGRIRDESSVRSEFGFAVELIKTTLAFVKGLPADERFAFARLQGFALDKQRSKLTLRVILGSAAGVTREIFLPVPVPIR